MGTGGEAIFDHSRLLTTLARPSAVEFIPQQPPKSVLYLTNILKFDGSPRGQPVVLKLHTRALTPQL